MSTQVPEFMKEKGETVEIPPPHRWAPLPQGLRPDLEKLGNLDRYRKAAEVLMLADEHLIEALADMRRAVDALDGQDPLGMLKGRQ
jgi:hypothetical protein